MNPLTPALVTVIFALAGWLIIPRITIALQSSAKREHFKGYITFLRRRISDTNSPLLAVGTCCIETFEVEKFNAQVLEVRSHITPKQLAGFDTACDDYRGVSFGAYNQMQKNEDAKAKALAALDRLLHCAQ